MTRWSVLQTEGYGVNVLPDEDTKVHITMITCPCNPTVRVYEQMLIEHNLYSEQ